MGGHWDWKVAGHGVVTLPLFGVWGWFLSEQQEWKHCRFAQGMSQQEKQGMGNKVQFYTAVVCQDVGIKGVRLWQLSKVELAHVHCGAFPN